MPFGEIRTPGRTRKGVAGPVPAANTTTVQVALVTKWHRCPGGLGDEAGTARRNATESAAGAQREVGKSSERCWWSSPPSGCPGTRSCCHCPQLKAGFSRQLFITFQPRSTACEKQCIQSKILLKCVLNRKFRIVLTRNQPQGASLLSGAPQAGHPAADSKEAGSGHADRLTAG